MLTTRKLKAQWFKNGQQLFKKNIELQVALPSIERFQAILETRD
jgi:hypothetical protein